MRNSFILFFILIELLYVPVLSKSNIDFNLLMERIRTKSNDIELDKFIIDQFDINKGYFVDIDYKDTSRTNWEPIEHLKRLYTISILYTDSSGIYFNSNLLYEIILKGLDFWNKFNPECDNWWYNQIAEPQLIGLILIQMRDGQNKIPEKIEHSLLEHMKKYGGNPDNWTGANRVDVALHCIYRACLLKDRQTLIESVNSAFSTLSYTRNNEGFQYDGSFLQHDLQLYIGGYGEVMIDGITKLAMYVRGMECELCGEKIKILSNFIRFTYLNTIRNNYMLFNVLGRSISRPNALLNFNYKKIVYRMLFLDPAHCKDYKNVLDNFNSVNIKPFHAHYYCGDYTLHVRPNYIFDVRMVSDRTVRCESVNNENLKSYFLSDGCTGIVSTGKEYYNIFPLWDWTRLPGVTSPLLDTIPFKNRKTWQMRGITKFSGGVSDSIYGCSAYSYYDSYSNLNTGASKSWFFFDDEIVCLGNVSSKSNRSVYTTVNQCWYNEDNSYFIDNSNINHHIKKNTIYNDSIKYILNDGIGYLFPQGGNVIIDNQEKKGCWYDINKTSSEQEIKGDVITISLDHGVNPSNNSYSYIILPKMKSKEQIREYINKNNIEVVANNNRIQSVYNHNLKIWYVVFFDAGNLSFNGMTIDVDKGCLLMIKELNRNLIKLSIVEPTQSKQSIIVKIKKGEFVSKEISMLFDDDLLNLGSTKTIEIQL